MRPSELGRREGKTSPQLVSVADAASAGRTIDFRRFRDEIDLGVLRDSSVRRLALAHLTSAAGDGIVLAALPFAILATGGTDGQFAIALAVQAFTMVAFLLPSGVIGDRFNRRRVLVTADLLRFGARCVFALLLIAGEATFWQLLLAQAANGVGTALFNTTMDGFVPEVIRGEKRLLKVNALRVLALSLGMTLGPLAGAFVFNAAGTAATFAVDAGTFLASALLIYWLPTPFVEEGKSKAISLRALMKDVTEGWTAFRKIRWYWHVGIGFAVINALVLAPYFVIGPHVAAESLGGSWAWSQILVGLGIGQLVGALAVMPWEPKRPLLAATSIVTLWVIPLVALAVVAPLGLLIVTAGLGGIAASMFESIWETVKQTHTQPHLRARLGSFDHLGGLGLVPLGYLLGAAILGTIGATAGLVGGALILAIATALIIGDRSVRDLESKDEQPVENRDQARESRLAPKVALVTAGTE
jgi:MFS family permease